MTDYTPYTESNALLAVVRDDLDEARRIIATMLPGERRQLTNQAHKLADLCQERDDLMTAVKRCYWTGYRNTCLRPCVGYIIVGARPMGVCQLHQDDAKDRGFDLHELPTEVTL